MRRVLATVFFPGFPAGNAAAPVLALLPGPWRGRSLARPDAEAGGLRAFRFDMRPRGGPDEETPFLED